MRGSGAAGGGAQRDASSGGAGRGVDATEHAVAVDLDSLWNFNDPAASEAVFRAAAGHAASARDVGRLAELLTQVARAQGLQRRFDEAHRTLDEATTLVEAEAADSPGMERARVRVLLESGRALNSAGRPGEAGPYFLEAWEAARSAGFEALAVDAAHMVAIVETPERAIEWNERALAFASSASEPRARRWCGSLLNNLGWAFHERADYAKALDAFERAHAARVEEGTAAQARIAKWCVARCLRSLGRIEEALARQEELRREGKEAGTPEDGFVHEELGECLLALGSAAQARTHFARAHELLAKDEWFAAREVARLQRLKALAAGVGDAPGPARPDAA